MFYIQICWHQYILGIKVGMTKKAQRYSKHCFLIIGRQQLYIKEDVLVSFTPYRKNKKIRHRSILPTFNSDHKHFTQAFTLPSAETEPEDVLKEDHERRVREAQAQIEQIWYPKPRSRQKYCGVCRSHYEDYLDHTSTERHNSLIQNSQYQKLLVEQARQFLQRHFAKQEPFAGESLSEEQLFKCLSAQTLQEKHIKKGLFFDDES